MEAYQNYNSVVVNLEPGISDATNVVRTATYEQAFLGEDFSEAGGNRRKRRQAKRIQKIEDKRERRTTRRKLKGDKQEERIDRRAKRKSKRQDIRDEQQERRMSRRDKRKGDEEDEKTTPEENLENDDLQNGVEDTSDDTSDDYSNDDTSDDTADDISDDTADDISDDTADDYSDEGGSGSDEVFAGDEESNFVSELNGNSNTPKSVKIICYQIEMTNEALTNLMQVKAIKQKQGQPTDEIDRALQTNFKKANNLEKKLEQFSGANGVSSSDIKKEKRKARMKRLMNAPIPPVILAKMLKQGWDKSKINKWWEQRGRQSMMKKFSFDGTTDEFGSTNELNEYWNPEEMGVPAYDYEQVDPQTVNLDFTEQSSNFSGSNDTFLRSLLIGGLIAFAGVYVIRKYKLLK
jgi:hypothetical protein